MKDSNPAVPFGEVKSKSYKEAKSISPKLGKTTLSLAVAVFEEEKVITSTEYCGSSEVSSLKPSAASFASAKDENIGLLPATFPSEITLKKD